MRAPVDSRIRFTLHALACFWVLLWVLVSLTEIVPLVQLSRLGTRRFVRIHKSAAVNIAEIHALVPLFKGDYQVVLRNGQRLRLSRRYRQSLYDLTGR